MQRKSSDKMAAMANDMNKSRAKIAIKMALENIQKNIQAICAKNTAKTR